MSTSPNRSPPQTREKRYLSLPASSMKKTSTLPTELTTLSEDDDDESVLGSQISINKETVRPSRWSQVQQILPATRLISQPYNLDIESAKKISTFHLAVQMKQALKRAQDEIKILERSNEIITSEIKRFPLAVSDHKFRIYDTSHVKPNDAVICDQMNDEALSLQSLLYYFSQKKISFGTMYWKFLNEIIQVLEANKRRARRTARLKVLATTLVSILYSTIGLMFLIMIVGVVSTFFKFKDDMAKFKG
ncbi:unnamed protein product [Didymodactylos carnosus]|uniref:Uncharacterized protein n=1 Tax=Didymodactylos carnosus TaxID=1234261 RepID=A0A814ECK0_9BILA|nr:unnamed protein product [Didymodactylos carnosus]CAF3742258.1 unnamed protein product [Didymodactylos carnosus]